MARLRFIQPVRPITIRPLRRRCLSELHVFRLPPFRPGCFHGFEVWVRVAVDAVRHSEGACEDWGFAGYLEEGSGGAGGTHGEWLYGWDVVETLTMVYKRYGE